MPWGHGPNVAVDRYRVCLRVLVELGLGRTRKTKTVNFDSVAGSIFVPWPGHVPTHVAGPSSTNCERLATASAREGFVCVCACTEPAGSGIGAVCVERVDKRGGKKC